MPRDALPTASWTGRRARNYGRLTKGLGTTLFILMTMISCCQGQNRRHVAELSLPILGQAEVIRGGITSYTKKVDKLEKMSLNKLKQEGYDPHQGLHRHTMVWSYNCQMANADRLRTWGDELKTTSSCCREHRGRMTLTKASDRYSYGGLTLMTFMRLKSEET